MPAEGYKNIGIPTELVSQIDALIKEHPEKGYKTVPEFIKNAIRLQLKEVLIAWDEIEKRIGANEEEIKEIKHKIQLLLKDEI